MTYTIVLFHLPDDFEKIGDAFERVRDAFVGAGDVLEAAVAWVRAFPLENLTIRH